jgi:hypothetical protein
MLYFDHILVTSENPELTATTLSEILGASPPTPEGRDNDMFRVDLEQGSFILFSETSGEIQFCHFALRVDAKKFSDVISNLKRKNIPFGNDHDGVPNGLTTDPLGGQGRIYWKDNDGHLMEVTY